MKNAEVPGGMYSNMVANLRSLGAEDVLEDAMALIPKVRRDAGLVPLVTPTSQIVGSQAVALAVDRRKGNPDYTNKNNQFVGLVKGEYGKTPVPVDPKFREFITGSAEEKPYDVSSYKTPANPEIEKFGGVKLAQNEEEFLLLELLPAVAKTYLNNKRKAEYEANKANAPQAAEAPKAAAATAGNGPVFNAPMGGTVMEIRVKPGDTVKPGDIVLVYEAMKMENDLACTLGGVVKQILVNEGDVMATDQPLIEFVAEGAAAPAPAAAEGPVEVMKAPMGGTVLELKAKPGDAVKAGDTLLVYEAMKMENNLVSDRAGVVRRFLIDEGDVMATDQPIVEFGAEAAPAAVAPKPVAAPKPAPCAKPAAPKAEETPVAPVQPIDTNRVLSPVDGGTGRQAAMPNANRRKPAGSELRLAAGTTLEIDVRPDGGISIYITAGK